MDDALTGAVAGFGAGQAAVAQAAQANIAAQRLGLEADYQKAELGRQDRAEARQKGLDSLTQLNDQAATLAAQARPHLAYQSAPPVDPTQDPEGYQKWLNSDEYKQHDAAAQDLDDQAQKIATQRKTIQDQIIGVHAEQVKDQAKQDMALVQSGTKKIQDLPDGDVSDLFAVKSNMDPSAFVADPKTGRMPVDDLNDAIHDGITTGNWQGKGTAIASMVPELHAAIGHPMAGGTVTGVSVNKVHAEDGDPDHLHFTPVYQVHMDDGSIKMVNGPDDAALPVTMKRLGQRATNLQQLGNLAAHPDLQQKIQKSFQDRTTSFHKLNDDLLAAGVPPNELLPAPYKYESAKQGEVKYAVDAAGRQVVGPDGKPVELRGEDKPKTTAQQRDDLLKILTDPSSTDEDKDAAREAYRDASAALHPQYYHGGLASPDRAAPSGGGGTSPKAAAAVQKQQKEYLTDAESRLAGEKGWTKKLGQWVDSKGKPVNDDELSAMRDAAQKSAATGKPLQSADLMKVVESARAAKNPAPAAALDHLKQHPELKDAFRKKYGYLP
jgi:hypothetical protein